MVIVVAVMPGADAVSAALELLPEPEPGPELELEPELHAATASAAAATAATAGTRSRCDLFIECLLSRGVPECQGVRGEGSPPSAGGSGWVVLPGLAEPALRRPEAWHPAWMPSARWGQRRSRKGREASALRPGFPAGR